MSDRNAEPSACGAATGISVVRRSLKLAAVGIATVLCCVFSVQVYIHATIQKLVYGPHQNGVRMFDEPDSIVYLIVPELIRLHKALDIELLIADQRKEFVAGDIHSFNARRRAWTALNAYQARSARARFYIASVPHRRRR